MNNQCIFLLLIAAEFAIMPSCSKFEPAVPGVDEVLDGPIDGLTFSIGDDLWSITPAISFRPSAQTVFRLNYRYLEQRDVLGNPPAKTGGFSFGI